MANLPDCASWRAAARPWTIGLEEEVMLLAPDGAPAWLSEDVLRVAPGDLARHAREETHGMALELATDPHATVAAAASQLRHLRAGLAATVRSRLNRARTRLADGLRHTITGTALSHAALEADERARWEAFYRFLQERPVARTYRDLFVPAVDVSNRNGRWVGVDTWSAHEREAIALGVRAQVVSLLAAADITVLEIDFTNPLAAPHHCRPQATFVHRLDCGRSRNLRIHYPVDRTLSKSFAERRQLHDDFVRKAPGARAVRRRQSEAESNQLRFAPARGSPERDATVRFRRR